MTVAQAAVYIARPITSYRLLAVGAGPREVGLVAASFALIPLFLAIPLGRFSDRRHGGPVLVAGCAVQTAACLILAVARTPLELAATTALLGLGHLALALGVQEVVARESDPAHHDRHFGLLTAGVSVGQLVGPVLGGALLQNRGGSSLTSATSLAMVVAGGLAAAATVCAALAERHRPYGADAVAESRRGSVRTILTTPGVPAGIFASIAVLSAADVFTAYMPVLGEQRGIAPGTVGVLLGLRAAASLGSRIGIGSIVRFVGLTLSHDVWVLALLTILAGFGLGFGQPLSMTLVVQLVPPYAQATALAIRLTGNRLGQVATPAAAGVVAGTNGTKPVFWMLSAMLGASAAAIQRPALARRFGARTEPELHDSAEDAL